MTGNIYEEVDVIEVIRNIGSKNKRLQAKLLQQLEKRMSRDDPQFEEERKFILDEVNGYTRSIIRIIFGNIEYIVK